MSSEKTIDVIMENNKVSDDTVPIILLSGFLGSGKTTTLKHLLENKEGKKLGVIVNDVAAVNIDAKLVSQQQASAANNGDKKGGSDKNLEGNDSDLEMIELENGCACCSMADELIASINQMLEVRDNWDAIVVELSGVADPMATKINWESAQSQNLPGTDKADIGSIVTLVDACTFGTDWMSWDSAKERDGWIVDDSNSDHDHAEGESCGHGIGERKVPELLAEQIESADLIVMNKIDMAGSEQVKVASSLARAINEKAKLLEVEFGTVSPNVILNIDDPASKEDENPEPCTDSDCSNPSCVDERSSSSCDDPASIDENSSKDSGCCSKNKNPCGDTTSADESPNDDSSCADSDCSNPSCADERSSSSCDDPASIDENSSYESKCSMSKNLHKTSTDKLGIINFVYKASRPFDTQRLMAVLGTWPVPKKDTLDLGEMKEAQKEGYSIDGKVDGGNPFLGVLRSKGFCWMSPRNWFGSRTKKSDAWRHNKAMFWSHAGKHFGINLSGDWWATIKKEEMKEILIEQPNEYERLLRDDFVTEEFGDRRQEIVFIGVNINEEKITNTLNECLVTVEEFSLYRKNLQKLRDSIGKPAEGVRLM